jgi:hypothetical protein
MPIMNIYYTEKLKDKLNSWNPGIIKIIKEEFNVSENSIEILYLHANPIYYGNDLNEGKDIYVEVKCKNKIDRTDAQFQRILNRLQTFFHEAGCSSARVTLFRFPPQDILMIK